jgi:hypothetical protein
MTVDTEENDAPPDLRSHSLAVLSLEAAVVKDNMSKQMLSRHATRTPVMGTGTVQ